MIILDATVEYHSYVERFRRFRNSHDDAGFGRITLNGEVDIRKQITVKLYFKMGFSKTHLGVQDV